MRNNTQKIFDKLSKGEFISADSTDNAYKVLVNDIEENYEDYANYYKEIGLKLEAGDGYYFFSRFNETKQDIEQKLSTFSKWLCYLDFLKCYNQSFTAGFQFMESHLIEQISVDVELKEKAEVLFRKYGSSSNQEIVEKLIKEMRVIGFINCMNETNGSYKVTSAFRYAEELVNMIQIANEDEIPE